MIRIKDHTCKKYPDEGRTQTLYNGTGTSGFLETSEIVSKYRAWFSLFTDRLYSARVLKLSGNAQCSMF